MEKVKNITSIIHIVSIVEKANGFFTKKTRRWWVREVNVNRERFGFFKKNYMEIKNQDYEHFNKLTRMNIQTFNFLLELLKPRLQKISKRKPICPEERLVITIMFLAHGTTPQVLGWCFKVGVSTIRKIIYETCKIIWEELHRIYLPPPNKEELTKIATNFYQKTGLPNCIGAIDGKHINIVCPRKSGSMFYNYKNRFSIALLAVCDSNYTFTYVDVGAAGSQSDGGIFARSEFGKKILNGEIDVPDYTYLPRSNISFPHFFVGDNAFPLKKNLLRPYPGRNLPDDKNNFNKKISRARVLIENTFGILANRWRVLRNDIFCKPENVDKIILATITLHNFLMLQKDEIYYYHNLVDQEVDGSVIPGEWRNDGPLRSVHVNFQNRSSAEAFGLRNVLKEYLLQNST